MMCDGQPLLENEYCRLKICERIHRTPITQCSVYGMICWWVTRYTCGLMKSTWKGLWMNLQFINSPHFHCLEELLGSTNSLTGFRLNLQFINSPNFHCSEELLGPKNSLTDSGLHCFLTLKPVHICMFISPLAPLL